MKKAIIIFVFFIAALPVFAQKIYTVEILPFEALGNGVSSDDAAEATRLVIAELSPCKTLTVLSGDQAKNGDYLVQGQITRLSAANSAGGSTGQNDQIVLTASIQQASSGKTLNTSKEQGPALSAISMFSFCTQIANSVPYPNYLLGKWRSTIDMIDGPVTCILEFRSDRTVQVQQYETWEHNGTNSLKYQAIGTGTFTFAGYHLLRSVTVAGQRIQTNAALGINLTLEDALPKYTKVNTSGLRMVFDESKNNFELVTGGMPCGDNYTGPSVYPSASVFYTKFSRTQ